MFEVTLKDLRKHGACISGYNKVVRALQCREFSADDEDRDTYIRFKHNEYIPLVFILESNGLDDALWSTRCISGHDRDLRLLAVAYARDVEHLMQDERSKAALIVAERHANGMATDSELAAARTAAWDAAWDAARTAAWDAALDAAWAAAWDAALDAAWDAARTAALAAAWDAARTAAWDARTAREKQKQLFIDMCNGHAPWQGEKK